MADDLKLTPQARALELLNHAARRSPYFLIAASGGKDSNGIFPLLALLQKKNPAVVVRAYNLFMVRGLQCIERVIEALCKRYKVPINYLPHPKFSDFVYQGFCGPRTDASVTAPMVKPVDVELAARVHFAAVMSELEYEDFTIRKGEETPRKGLSDLKVDPFDIWVVSGHRKSDSLERRAMLTSFRRQPGGREGLNVNEMRVYPVFDWSAKEVLAYCRAHDLPPAADLGKRNNAGIDPGIPESMRALRDLYPADFERVCAVFPLARAVAAGLDD